MNEKQNTSSEKQKRLEKALRENLRKRKTQQRERVDSQKKDNSLDSIESEKKESN
jgi:hypothetical protein